MKFNNNKEFVEKSMSKSMPLEFPFQHVTKEIWRYCPYTTIECEDISPSLLNSATIKVNKDMIINYIHDPSSQKPDEWP